LSNLVSGQEPNNPCAQKTNPCLNSGICILIEKGVYTCSCPIGFGGIYCQIDFCSPTPCQNNGTCFRVVDGFKCSCPSGYSGDTCQNDPCFPNPCKNGGLCSRDPNKTFKCTCPSGYDGEICENDIDPCSPNPCLYGRSCQLGGPSGFTCDCPTGYKIHLNKYCFRLASPEGNWANQRLNCQSDGGDLVVISNQERFDILKLCRGCWVLLFIIFHLYN